MRVLAIVGLLVSCGPVPPGGAGGGGGGGAGGGSVVYAQNLYLCSYTLHCTGVASQTYSGGPWCAKSATEADSMEQADCSKGSCSCSPGGCSKYQDGCY